MKVKKEKRMLMQKTLKFNVFKIEFTMMISQNFQQKLYIIYIYKYNNNNNTKYINIFHCFFINKIK